MRHGADDHAAFGSVPMPNRLRRLRSGIALLAAVLLLASLACQTRTETRSSRLEVGDSPRLSVDSQNGKLEINASNAGSITVDATIYDAEHVNYRVEQEGDAVRVVVEPSAIATIGRRGADIVVRAPPDTVIDGETRNGAVSVTGIAAPGRVRTTNGDVRLRDIDGDFTAETSSGRVVVTNMTGALDIATSNGAIELRNVAGEVVAETSNGAVSFTGVLKPGTDSRISTSNGAVTVAFDETPSLKLDARTTTGKVTVDYPILATRAGDEEMIGTIGGGEAALRIRTTNGDITVRPD